MNLYTYETANPEHLGTSYGYHTFQVEAENQRDARDKVHKLTKFALVLVLTERLS